MLTLKSHISPIDGSMIQYSKGISTVLLLGRYCMKQNDSVISYKGLELA